MTDLSTLLAELDATVKKMTPRPWHALEQIDEKWRFNGDDEYPLARFTQGYDEQKANARGIVALRNAYPALKAGIEQLQREVMKLRKHRTEYDCHYTLGDVADISGSHCPLDEPCQRCLLAQRTEALQNISEQLPCTEPCEMRPALPNCPECGAWRSEKWCAGCVARAALAAARRAAKYETEDTNGK